MATTWKRFIKVCKPKSHPFRATVVYAIEPQCKTVTLNCGAARVGSVRVATKSVMTQRCFFLPTNAVFFFTFFSFPDTSAAMTCLVGIWKNLVPSVWVKGGCSDLTPKTFNWQPFKEHVKKVSYQCTSLSSCKVVLIYQSTKVSKVKFFQKHRGGSLCFVGF